VNHEMRKTVIRRAGLALAVYAVIVAFGASASPQPPWALFLTVFGMFLTFAVVSSLFGDRKLAIWTGRTDPPWAGSSARWTQTSAAIPLDSAAHFGVTAISRVGGRNAELISDWEAIGWIGSSLTNIPEWQEYQLDVLVSRAPDGHACFTCSARPRWKMGWGGASKSARLAESLRSEVERLVH
jgi:hypothetical protein